MRNYYKHPLDFVVNIKKIVTIEYFELNKNTLLQSEKHNFYEFAYVDNGNVSYRLDNDIKEIKEKEILIVKPNQIHSIITSEKEKNCLFIICFDCASPFLTNLNNFTKKLTKQEVEIIKKIISESKKTYQLPLYDTKKYLKNPLFGGEQTIALYFELFLINIIRNNIPKKNIKNNLLKNESENLYSCLIDYLEKSIYKKINIPQICKEFNYSKTHIYTLFKKKTGKSIIEYFNELKIEEAKKMLTATNYTSKQISNILSYSDPRYFLYAFKKATNLTPTEFKEKIQKF